MTDTKKKIKLNSLTFGRIIIDLKHQFFGSIDQIAFVICDTFAAEKDDKLVRVDHFRANFEIEFAELRNTESFYVTDKFIDCNKNVQEQLADALENYKVED